VFAEFVRFKTVVELETGNILKMLRSDNGGEYTSRKFEGYLVEKEIKHQLTMPYTPQ
jgi:transposase InsO family protein